MAFSLTDFKKTTRVTKGRSVLYPHQLRDDRYLAAISYAIDYYERTVGRPRSEMQAETLLEFFGDPKLARGIVACLGRSYTWREQSFSEVLPQEHADQLARQGISTPLALRAWLYHALNQHHDGFLPTKERERTIAALCADLELPPSYFDDLLYLDTPANALLTKVALTPDPQDIVALYNYHSLETPLRYAETLQIVIKGDLWPVIRTMHNIARRYQLAYSVEYDQPGMFGREATVTWRGTRDALGSYRGSGRRIVRALLRLLAAHPSAITSGEAIVHLRGKTSWVILDKHALKTLGTHITRMPVKVDSWEPLGVEQLRTDWSRAFVRGETAGWRLRRDPEPLITEQGIIVPDFGLYRGALQGALVLAETPSAVEALLKPLQALNGRSLVVVATPHALAPRLAGLHAVIIPSQDRALPRVIATALPSPATLTERHATKWQRLEQLLEVEGFVDDHRISEILDLESQQVEQAIRGWHAKELTYIPGIGLCTASTVTEIRTLLKPEHRRAA